MDLTNCSCTIAPIVRYINLTLLDGLTTVELDSYKEELNTSASIMKLNTCLKKHGFSGQVEDLDGLLFYHRGIYD